MKPKPFILLMVCLLCGLLVTVSCSDSNSPENKKAPPKLPPLKSVEMSFSFFKSHSQTENIPASIGSARNSSQMKFAIGNFSNILDAISKATTISVATPNFSFVKNVLTAAKTTKPKRNENGQWEWDYSIHILNPFSNPFNPSKGIITIDIRLTALRNPNGATAWKLYDKYESPSRPVFPHFNPASFHLYLSGIVNAGRHSGKWTYYNFSSFNFLQRSNNTKRGRVVWKIPGAHKLKFNLSVLYTFPSLDSLFNLLPDSLRIKLPPDSLQMPDDSLQFIPVPWFGFLNAYQIHKGDQLRYTKNGAVIHVEYHYVINGKVVTIQWNTKTHAGFIIDPGYHNGKKACWDSKFKNIRCPQPMPGKT